MTYATVTERLPVLEPTTRDDFADEQPERGRPHKPAALAVTEQDQGELQR